jgi:hypothetical protein
MCLPNSLRFDKFEPKGEEVIEYRLVTEHHWMIKPRAMTGGHYASVGQVHVNSFRRLSYDSCIASSKASSLHNTI